jgi:5-methylcytosine-specific restriction endonuclease McrA
MPTGNRRSGAFHRKKPAIRRKLFDVWPCCHWCGVPLDIDAAGDAWNYPTIDHILRRVDGGTNAMYNLTLACARCNAGRHHLTATSSGER